MLQTAVLVLSDTLTIQHWIGRVDRLQSSSPGYENADLPLLPTIRLCRPRAIGFACYHSWVSYTQGEPYEFVRFYRPRLLRELVNNYERLAATLESSKDWRPLRPYGEDEQLSQVKLEFLLQSQS